MKQKLTMNCKYAISEFDNEFILNQAKQRNLNIIIIGERHNIKNKNKLNKKLID